ncbi:hypothetical protein EDD16DRAFT_1514567 [Pisolithus croceorrhizus]|nr:hypothetical protein EDD16DRAFT_1514567 [Pisolithus croceorrhizus]
MPPRDKLYRCYCPGAVRWIKVAQLAVVESLASSAVSQQGNSDIDSLSAALFASSLCDDGPDLDSQPHKLWASREEFQRVASTDIGDIGVPNISDLVDAVGWISIGDSLFSGGVLSLNTRSDGLQSRSEVKSSWGEMLQLMKEILIRRL